MPIAHPEDTPDTPTIRSLVEIANARPELSAAVTVPGRRATHLKTWLLMLDQPDGTSVPLAVGLPGDREVDLRLVAVGGARRAKAVRGRQFAKFPGPPGSYIGPGLVGEDSITGIRYPLDPRVVVGTR